MATSKQKVGIANVITTADKLAEQHVAYTEQFVTRANEELYKILGGIMALCIEIQSHTHCEQIIKQMKKTLLDDYQVRTQANSTATAIVVRYVTRTGRKTAHVYGRVIQTALDAGITAEQLPDYIRDNNGIDAIRKRVANAKCTETLESRYTSMRNNLIFELHPRNKPSLGTVKFADGSKHLWGSNHTEYRLLLCATGNGLDEPQIVGVISPNRSLEDHALKDYFVCCDIASADRNTSDFHDLCKKGGRNMDDILYWASENGLQTADDAAAHLKNLTIKPAELEAKIEAEVEANLKLKGEIPTTKLKRVA